MKILVVGGGGREHALCAALARSPRCATLFCAPGNAGTADIAENLPIDACDVPKLVALCKATEIDLVVVGPEQPLAEGLVDALAYVGVRVFGPTRTAADIEASKSFMKSVCMGAGVPTAAYDRFSAGEAAAAQARVAGHFHAHLKTPLVVKADGLAAGKGVVVAESEAEAAAAVDAALREDRFGEAGRTLLIEDHLDGEELSFFAICDGEIAIPAGWAQDHKRAFDGDDGPNTGGMGAYGSPPIVNAALEAEAMTTIVQPTLAHLARLGRPFVGVLFAGLMRGPGGLKVIEFNARFGDPETQTIMPRVKSDLVDVFDAATRRDLSGAALDLSDEACLSVVLAQNGYPGPHGKGSVLRGLEAAAADPLVDIFHAGTKRGADGAVEAHGGRAVCVSGRGPTLRAARDRAYAAVAKIDWPEGFHRTDIGWRALG